MGLTGAIGALLGNAVWFLRSRHYGGHTSLDSMLNMHLRVDFFMTLLTSVLWLAFTPTILGFRVSFRDANPFDFIKVHEKYPRGIGSIGRTNPPYFVGLTKNI